MEDSIHRFGSNPTSILNNVAVWPPQTNKNNPYTQFFTTSTPNPTTADAGVFSARSNIAVLTNTRSAADRRMADINHLQSCLPARRPPPPRYSATAPRRRRRLPPTATGSSNGRVMLRSIRLQHQKTADSGAEFPLLHFLNVFSAVKLVIAPSQTHGLERLLPDAGPVSAHAVRRRARRPTPMDTVNFLHCVKLTSVSSKICRLYFIQFGVESKCIIQFPAQRTERNVGNEWYITPPASDFLLLNARTVYRIATKSCQVHRKFRCSSAFLHSPRKCTDAVQIERMESGVYGFMQRLLRTVSAASSQSGTSPPAQRRPEIRRIIVKIYHLEVESAKGDRRRSERRSSIRPPAHNSGDKLDPATRPVG
ncbi:hypothetical protein EVAR_27256_1 [Eumeta japonica]|uniref:Uncharacterized protein n=1 Tax=Eumeta variegata TaxID=151549 RepID=A0A4C1W1C9_EUMVA|nr:hypothetical protein EVAR_27256_1 [Eumeta japonica]